MPKPPAAHALLQPNNRLVVAGERSWRGLDIVGEVVYARLRRTARQDAQDRSNMVLVQAGQTGCQAPPQTEAVTIQVLVI